MNLSSAKYEHTLLETEINVRDLFLNTYDINS